MDQDLADQIKLNQPYTDRYIGQTVADKYEIGDRIGVGGMGVVYKARHVQLNRVFAIKIMAAGNFGFDTKALARFQQEARTVSGLHHHNLVGVHDFGTMSDGAPYLVMDYVEGQSLSAIIKEKGALDVDTALTIATQICDGLQYAHDKGVIHRDLKPSNIIVSRGNAGLSARILDFGIAKVVDINAEERKTLTQTGEIIGSPHYMSPEQCMGYQIDARSDIYSLGCVIFEMLAGRPVFDAPSPLAIMMLHMNERAPLFRSIPEAASVRPEVERIVMQTLEKEPDMRYQCVEDLRNDLQLAREGKNPVKELAQARKRRRNALTFAKSLVMPAVVVAATTLGIGGYMVYAELSKPDWVRSWEAAQHQMVIQNLSAADANFVQAEQQAEARAVKGPELLKLLVNHSQLLRTLGDNGRGVEVGMKALQISEGLGEHAKRGEILDAIAEASLANGQYQQAATAGLASLQEKQKNQLHPLFIAHSYQRLGQIYRQLRSWQNAETADNQALEIYLKLGDKASAADIFEQLGNLYADQNRHDVSLINARRSYELNVQARGEQHILTKKVKGLVERQQKLLTNPIPSNR